MSVTAASATAAQLESDAAEQHRSLDMHADAHADADTDAGPSGSAGAPRLATMEDHERFQDSTDYLLFRPVDPTNDCIGILRRNYTVLRNVCKTQTKITCVEE